MSELPHVAQPSVVAGDSERSSTNSRLRSSVSEVTSVKQCSYCFLVVVSGDLEQLFAGVVVASWGSIVVLRLGG